MIDSPLLKHTDNYVAGRWVKSDCGAMLPVINPATGEHLADVPALGRAQVTAALEAAEAAMSEPTPLEKRREWLLGIAERLVANKSELGRIITLENGKPLKEGVGEVEYAAGFFQFCGENVRLLESRRLAETVRGARWEVHHRPAGVAALITPWNFPLAMLAKKLSAALAAGCASVSKPAEATPLTPIALWALIEDLGLPPGMMNLVTGDPAEIGRLFCTHPAVRVVSFTGSTEVGKILSAQSAPHVKRLALELGGNAPFVVFDDADLPAAADHLIANKFRAGGQTCVCANRIYAHRAVAGAFTELVVERVKKLKMGNGLHEGTDVGPLINRKAFDKVARHVGDALRLGATRVVGSDPPRPAQDWGAFYPPAVLTGVTPEMLVCREETFGPVVAIAAFGDEAEALRLANGTESGLAAYVFTRDEARAARFVPRLRFGHVGLNTGSGPAPQAPFGGTKQSGFGREGGVECLFEFTEAQAVAAGA